MPVGLEDGKGNSIGGSDLLPGNSVSNSWRAGVKVRQYKHREKKGLVTVPGTMNDELAPGTLNSILKQAGLKT